MGTPSSRTTAAITARRQRTAQMLTRVENAISQLPRHTGRLTVRALAHRAEVSATFLYENPDARRLLAAARAAASQRRDRAATQETDRCESAWRERALNAEHALGLAHTEILTQRRRIGELTGHIRDLQQPAPDSAARLAAENTTLQQHLRQLTGEHRTLQERLEAARSTNRFLDRRIADLEARLAEHLTIPG